MFRSIAPSSFGVSSTAQPAEAPPSKRPRRQRTKVSYAETHEDGDDDAEMDTSKGADSDSEAEPDADAEGSPTQLALRGRERPMTPFNMLSQEQIQRMNARALLSGEVAVHRVPVLKFLQVPRNKLFGAFRPPIPDGWCMPARDAGLAALPRVAKRWDSRGNACPPLRSGSTSRLKCETWCRATKSHARPVTARKSSRTTTRAFCGSRPQEGEAEPRADGEENEPDGGNVESEPPPARKPVIVEPFIVASCASTSARVCAFSLNAYAACALSRGMGASWRCVEYT